MLELRVHLARVHHAALAPERAHRAADPLRGVRAVVFQVDADRRAAVHAARQSADDPLSGLEVGERPEFGFASLRDWFRALYETLLGNSQGPRMGSFIALYGIANTRKLIAEALG